MNRVEVDKLRMAGAVGGFLGTLFSIYAFLQPGSPMSMVMMTGLPSLAALGYFGFTLGKAACPDCGMMRSGIFLVNNASLECSDCGNYFHTKKGEIVLTASDAVETFPAFSTPCPQQIIWPKGCAVCQNEATRQVDIKLTLEQDAPVLQASLTAAVSLGTFKMVSKKLFTVPLPVCGQHGDDSAELNYKYEEEQLQIAFRSRAYRDAFAEANGPVFWDS